MTKHGGTKDTATHTCWTCDSLIPIGEGDHLCEAYQDKTGCPLMVIADYMPTDEFMGCGGKGWNGSYGLQSK